MSSSINATTTNGILLNSDNSGILQLQSGGTTIATISSTGLQQNVGAPAFSAYAGSLQTISSGTYTKIQFQTKEFDTNSNFDNTTNYRFTPTVAGYYQISGAMGFYSAGTIYNQFVTIYKNGSIFKYFTYLNVNSSGVINGSCLVYLNGTTDYVELYGYVSSSSTITIQTGSQTYFQAAMVRSA